MTRLTKYTNFLDEQFFVTKYKSYSYLMSFIEETLGIEFQIHRHENKTEYVYHGGASGYMLLITNEDDLLTLLTKIWKDLTEEQKEILVVAIEKLHEKELAKQELKKEVKQELKEELGNIGHFVYFMRMAGASIDPISRTKKETKKEKKTRADGYIKDNFAKLESRYKKWLIISIVIFLAINILLLSDCIQINLITDTYRYYQTIITLNMIMWFVIYKINALHTEARRSKQVLQEKLMLMSAIKEDIFKDNEELKNIVLSRVFERDFYIPRKGIEEESSSNSAMITGLLNKLKDRS